jgi:hypothetical protein
VPECLRNLRAQKCVFVWRRCCMRARGAEAASMRARSQHRHLRVICQDDARRAHFHISPSLTFILCAPLRSRTSAARCVRLWSAVHADALRALQHTHSSRATHRVCC